MLVPGIRAPGLQPPCVIYKALLLLSFCLLKFAYFYKAYFYSALYDAADDLDVLFVKQDSQWDVFVQTQRDTLVHRPKRRKRD